MTKKQNKPQKKPKIKIAIFFLILIIGCLSYGLYNLGYIYGVSEGKKLAFDEILINIQQWDQGFYYEGIYFNPSLEDLELAIEDSKGNLILLNKTSWAASWKNNTVE